MYRSSTILCALGAMLLTAGLSSAQTEPTRPSRSRSEDGYNYDYAVSLGFGIDKVNFDQRAESVGVSFFTGSFRFNFWGNDNDDGGDFGRRRRPSPLKAYLEAELGYWNDSELRPFQSDLLVGLNAIVAVPTGPAEVFFGAGFGYHFFGGDASLPGFDLVASDDRELGANLQFGVDINFTDHVALYGSGRYDILLGDLFDFQTKVSGGARFKF